MFNTQTQQYDKLKSETNKAADRANKKVAEFSENASEAAHNAGEKVRNFLETARTDVSEASRAVKSQIKNKPIQSSLIALGIGYVIGALARR
jgi:ElaB/YqjD/DUF883 family membrane-anchored ribosome-binding protein